MWALDPPCARPTERLGADTPLALLAVLALGTAATWALVEHGALPSRAMQVAGVTAGHGALLATPLAWARVRAASGVVAIALHVLAAECFLRGGLLNRAPGGWPVAFAAALATTGYVVRYLVDPLLPKSIELVVGAVFYLALLGAINCWLLWWSESLVPGLLSALVFFAAYRTLGSG